MKKLFRTFALATAAVALLAMSASAQITYADAQPGNTTFAPSAGGGPLITNTTDSVDGIWRFRTTFGLAATATSVPGAGVISTAGGALYESTGNSVPSDDVPRLVTSVSGLSLATYDVFVYFWNDQNSSPWRIRAGLTDDVSPLTLFISGGVGVVDTGVRDQANNGGRILWQAYLGSTAGDVTSISVFVEDAPATSNNERTWYDGIGYSIVPEPTSATLLGIGALVGTFVVRRRRA